MPAPQTVLLVGGTGRTGRRVLEQLLGRGANVRVVVRSARKLPASAARDPHLTVVEASLLSLSDEDLVRQVRGSDAIVSCLGHVTTLRGVLGPPHDLVTRATTRLCDAIQALQGSKPVKFILMGSVSVNHPGGLDKRRGMFEKAILGVLRAVIPPARDNQRAADFLHDTIGMTDPFVQWVVIRPDTLLAGEVTQYTLHKDLVNSIFAPGSTRMANVAHFMCELVTYPKAWADWKGKLPVIVNAASGASPVARSHAER